MRIKSTWLLLTLLLLFTCTVADAGDPDKKKKKKTNWSLTLDSRDKNPYGGYLAYTSLKSYFPRAKVSALSRDFRYNSLQGQRFTTSGGRKLLVLIGFTFYLSDLEWDALMSFVRDGNEVVLFAGIVDKKILTKLDIEKKEEGLEFQAPRQGVDGTENLRILSLATNTGKKYGYAGRSLRSYFKLAEWMNDTVTSTAYSDIADYSGDDNAYTDADTLALEVPPSAYNSDEEAQYPTEDVYADETDVSELSRPEELGYIKHIPNFLRYSFGSGHFTIHASPLVLSNYFLLQEGNTAYLDGIWATLPADITTLYWNVYTNHKEESSSMSSLLKHPAIRAAFYLALAALLLYILFSMRRLQRIVPIIPPIENTSVSFVETVGRLYFNKGAHSNLAEKMTQHFLEWVRTYYYLDTARLNDAFEKSLAAKSGKPPAYIQNLMQRIHTVRTAVAISEQELIQLYMMLQTFYNNNPTR